MGHRRVGTSVYDFLPLSRHVGRGKREEIQNPTGTKATLAKETRHKVSGSRPENSW